MPRPLVAGWKMERELKCPNGLVDLAVIVLDQPKHLTYPCFFAAPTGRSAGESLECIYITFSLFFWVMVYCTMLRLACQVKIFKWLIPHECAAHKIRSLHEPLGHFGHRL